MRRRVIFMGTPDFAVPAFAAVCARHEVLAVYCRAPAKQGRGMQLTAAPVQQAAEAAGIEVLTPASLKDPAALARFKDFAPDLAIVVAYGMILPQSWLDVPRLGCWNIHASLLPRWRGAAPIQRALMAGDTETGIAIMQMQAGLDTGDILLEKRLPIAADDTAQSLHDRLADLGGTAISEALEKAEHLTPVPQPAAGVTYAEKIDKAEARLDFARPAAELDRLIRGLSPFPGAWFEADGKRVKVLAGEAMADTGPVGEVAINAAGEAMIYCGQGALRLLHVQKAGKPPVTAAEFIRGRGLRVGQNLRTET